MERDREQSKAKQQALVVHWEYVEEENRECKADSIAIHTTAAVRNAQYPKECR